MPIYRYEVLDENGAVKGVFEQMQGISDPPLEKHPRTDEPVRRVFGAPSIGGRWSESSAKKDLSDKNLAAHGFQKWQRSGKGNYERTVGSQGPEHISLG